MVKKKEKKGKCRPRPGERFKKMRRHLKKRATDRSISTALDTQFPAFATLLETCSFGALAATSKEHLARLASPPVLSVVARLGANGPVLSSPAVSRRIQAAPLPGLEVLRIISADPEAHGKSPEYNFECIVDVRLKNGTRILERVHAPDYDGFPDCNDHHEDYATFILEFKFQDTTAIVIESAREFKTGDPEAYSAGRDRKEFDEFCAQTQDVGDARVTLVREDGKFLSLFRGSVEASPTEDWLDCDEDYNYDFPYKIAVHEEARFSDRERLICKAAVWTENTKNNGRCVYRAGGLEMRFKSHNAMYSDGSPERTFDSKHDLLGLLNYTGSWH